MSLRRTDIVCQQAVELVTDYLEGALSLRDRRRLAAHLKLSPNCAAYLAQIKLTIRLAGEIEPADLAPEARQDLTDLYRRGRSEEVTTPADRRVWICASGCSDPSIQTRHDCVADASVHPPDASWLRRFPRSASPPKVAGNRNTTRVTRRKHVERRT